MKRSVEHILTTHTGSLPRPPALTQRFSSATAVSGRAPDSSSRSARPSPRSFSATLRRG